MMTESGTISVARMTASTAVRPRNWYFDSAKAAIELTKSVMIVAVTVTKAELRRKREEVEVFQRLEVVLGGEAQLAQRFSLVDRHLDDLPGRGRVDHLRHRADPPDLREHPLPAVLARHRVERQRLVVARRPSPSWCRAAGAAAGIRPARPAS